MAQQFENSAACVYQILSAKEQLFAEPPLLFGGESAPINKLDLSSRIVKYVRDCLRGSGNHGVEAEHLKNGRTGDPA
jgi:hypothetical protein